MAGRNSKIAFPRHASLHSPFAPSTSNFSSKSAKEAALQREAGVFVVSRDLAYSPANDEASSRPRSSRRGQRSEPTPLDHTGARQPLQSQISPEGHSLLAELDPDDPDYRRRRKTILDTHTRVWEDVPATPLIIDFTDVQEPLFPSITHPSVKHSQHPDRPLYHAAKTEAFTLYPGSTGRALRHAHYWTQMDAGLLPADFNPYPPNSAHHNAFEHRVTLRDDRPTTTSSLAPGLSVLATPRQVRARARRKAERGERLTDEEFSLIFTKPVDEWDVEELSRGYPRLDNGSWPARPPSRYLAAEIKERVDRLFKDKVRSSMNQTTVRALSVLASILDNDDTDFRGKPVVSASTRVDAAKFLIEHLLGKPKQTVETDISVKLQGILAGVMVSPEMSLPDNPALPVGPTGRMLAGQRGYRQDYQDHELLALQAIGVVDAEVIDEDGDT